MYTQTSHHQKILQPFNFFGQIYYKYHGLDSHLFLPPMQNRAKMFQKVLEGGLIMESLEKSLDCYGSTKIEWVSIWCKKIPSLYFWLMKDFLN